MSTKSVVVRFIQFRARIEYTLRAFQNCFNFENRRINKGARFTFWRISRLNETHFCNYNKTKH